MSRDIIDLIDAAIGCGHCGGALGDSPSTDFCSDECQTTWHAQRADVPEAMPEPDDLPEHVFNLVELHSTETCVACTEGGWCPERPFATLVNRRRPIEVTGPFGPVVTLAHDQARRARLNDHTPAGEHRVLTEWEQQLVDGVPDYTWTPAEVFTAPAGQPAPDSEPGTEWQEFGTIAAGFHGGLDVPMPLAHFLVDEDGAVHASGIRDVRINSAAFLRHFSNGRVVGVDPSGDVVTRSWFDEASSFTRGLVDAFRAAGEAAAALAPLADELRQDDIPPTDPRARALWQRQRRNTGPRPSQQRAPRTINPRRTR